MQRVGDRQRERRPKRQLPEARKDRIKVGDRIRPAEVKIEKKRQTPGADGERPKRAAKAHAEVKRKRPDDIELFLDPEAPEIEERLEVPGLFVEIAGFRLQERVGEETGAGRDMQAQPLEFVGVERNRAERQASGENHRERGKNPAHATRIKVGETKIAGRQFARDDRRDQKA